MKEKILKEINDFVNTLYTCFKIGAGDFAKSNFPKMVDNFYDDKKTDEENLKAIKDAFETEKKLQKFTGNLQVMELIDAFQKGWLDKI